MTNQEILTAIELKLILLNSMSKGYYQIYFGDNGVGDNTYNLVSVTDDGNSLVIANEATPGEALDYIEKLIVIWAKREWNQEQRELGK